MTGIQLWGRLRDRLRRERAARCARRDVVLSSETPLISFTFDDFPKSALFAGGAMLGERGWRGTYYTSFGLAGTTAPTGRIFDLEDLPFLLEQRHELGCHTYGHLHAWDTPAPEFEVSIKKNRQFLDRHFPGATFPTLSYPISCPNPGVKRRAGTHFSACRGGGQVCNRGTMDLNHLRSFFLEQVGENMSTVQHAIDETVRCKGWLIFSTHDVEASPTRYGVTAGFFEKVLAATAASGACVVPAGVAVSQLRLAGISKNSEPEPSVR
jgi:hypothetical protein